MAEFAPFRELVHTAFKYSLMLLQYPMVKITEGMQREISDALGEVVTLLAESLSDPAQPRMEISIKLSREHVVRGNQLAIDSAYEHLYNQAGVKLAQARCIPLCWPEPEKIYLGFPRHYGWEDESVDEHSDWYLLELKLTIPVLKP